MRPTIQYVAAVSFSVFMMTASTAFSDEDKVPEDVKQEVVEAEKQTPEAEKTEEGEASGNVEDCERSNKSDDPEDAVESKNLDKCEEMVK